MQVTEMAIDVQHGAEMLMVAVQHILDPLSHGDISYVEVISI